jgi:hypothetical protein
MVNVLYSTWNNLNHSQESQTNSQQCRFGSNWRSLWVSPQHAQGFTLVGNIAEKKGTQQVGCPTNLALRCFEPSRADPLWHLSTQEGKSPALCQGFCACAFQL